MKISVKDGNHCQKIIKVEVEKEVILKEFDLCYQALAPKAKIPGFRPGKAPKDIVRMHYHKEAREQVVKNLLNDSYRNAIEEKAIQPLGYPQIEDIQFTDDLLSYQATVEVRPKVKLSKIKGLSAKKPEVSFDEKEVDEHLERIQEAQAQFKAVEDRAAQMNDFILADYVCTVEGKEIDKRQGDMFELKEDEFLKGMSAQLVGVKAGEEKEVVVMFPEKFGQKELAGKEAVFKMSIKEIKSKSLPEINDDLAKEAGEFDSLQGLKDKIAGDIKYQKEHDADHAYEEALLEELVKKNKIDLPAGLVQKRVEYLVDQAKSNFLQRGSTEEEFENQKEKLAKEFQLEAEKQVHLAFLLDEIAKKEEIVVGEEDMQKEIQKIAKRFKQKPETVEKYYTDNPGALDAVRDQVLNKKTIEFLKKNAK